MQEKALMFLPEDPHETPLAAQLKQKLEAGQI